MASKIIVKNNINSELSITHADNKPAKSIIGSDIAVAVNTINDFPLGASDGDTVIVRDLNRGGTFIYDSTEVANDNQGTNFNGWIRQYSGAVNVKWFGAVDDYYLPNGSINPLPTDNYIQIQNAFNTANIVVFPQNSVFYVSAKLSVYSGFNGNNSILICDSDGLFITKKTGYERQGDVQLYENLKVHSNKKGISNTGISFGNNYMRQGTMRNIEVSFFSKNIDLSVSNLYINLFDMCNFNGYSSAGNPPVGTNIYVDVTGLSNSGENIVFTNCTIADADVCINNNGFELLFDNCSIDYSTTYLIADSYSSRNIFQNCHFETRWCSNAYGLFTVSNSSLLQITGGNFYVNNSASNSNTLDWNSHIIHNVNSSDIKIENVRFGIDPTYPYVSIIDKDNVNSFSVINIKNNSIGKPYTPTNSILDSLLTNGNIEAFFSVANTFDTNTTINYNTTDIPTGALNGAKTVSFNNTVAIDYYVTLTGKITFNPNQALSFGGFFKYGAYTTTPSSSMQVWFIAGDGVTSLFTESIPIVTAVNTWEYKNLHTNFAPAGTSFVQFRVTTHIAKGIDFNMNSLIIGVDN